MREASSTYEMHGDEPDERMRCLIDLDSLAIYQRMPYALRSETLHWLSLHSAAWASHLSTSLSIKAPVNYVASAALHLRVVVVKAPTASQIPGPSACIGTSRLMRRIGDGDVLRLSHAASPSYPMMTMPAGSMKKIARVSEIARGTMETFKRDKCGDSAAEAMMWSAGHALADPAASPLAALLCGKGGEGKPRIINLLASSLMSIATPLARDPIGRPRRGGGADADERDKALCLQAELPHTQRSICLGDRSAKLP